jgi:transcriptional regulator with XRE-family HTH domain
MVAELARNLRRTRRYNATALARDAGRPYATVQRVLSGRQRPSVRLVEDLARAAGVDPWLLYDVPELVDVDDPVPYALTEEALAWLD